MAVAIHHTAVIGSYPESRDFHGVSIHPNLCNGVKVEAFVTVDAGTLEATFVGRNTWLMKRVHVGHDAQIGENCELAPGCIVGGHVKIGDRVRVGMGAIFKPFVTIGDDARIGCGAVVIRDVPAGQVWAGNPARMIHETQELHSPLEVDGWEQVAEAVGAEYPLGQEA